MHLTEILTGFTLMGGEWVLWLLVLASLASVSIMVERGRVMGGEVRHGRVRARVLAAAEKAAGRGRLAVLEAAETQMLVEKLSLERGLIILGTMGNIAPFVGLFGTVLGIIKAFHDLSVSGTGNSQVVMRGISEALVATAIGLLVAIPAVIAYNGFTRRVQAVLADAEHAAREYAAGLPDRG